MIVHLLTGFLHLPINELVLPLQSLARNITNNSPIITLCTGFDLQDEYVGVMKGAILGHAPEGSDRR